MSWWLYKGTVYFTQGHPRPTEVAAFIKGREIVADFRKEPVFPEDAVFKIRTIGKAKPPRVPIAEVIKPHPEPRPGKPGAKKKARPRKHVYREHIPRSYCQLLCTEPSGGGLTFSDSPERGVV